MSRADTRRPVRILLADSAPLSRTGYRVVLNAEPDLSVVAEAGDGAEAVALARRLLPDVAVLDARLPRLDAVAVATAVRRARLPVSILVLTTVEDEYPMAVLRAGATGLLGKGADPIQLVAAIRAMATGGAVLGPQILPYLLDRLADRPPPEPVPRPMLSGLTGREQEVLIQLAHGLSNAEIARSLSVSETTVKTHVGRLLAKLDLRDRVQAVVLAYESGLVRPGTTRAGPRAWGTRHPRTNRQADP